MMSPVLKVYVKKSKRDLSDRIESLTYEETIEKENLVTLNVYVEHALALADDEDIVEGTTIQFQYGEAGGEMSPVYEAQIKNVAMDYSSRVTMTIKALGTGIAMKKNGEQKVWKNKRASDIAREIAERFGLTPEIEDTKKVYKSIPQANKSDFDFLQYLAGQEQSGRFEFYTDNSTLYFRRKDYKKPAKYLFTYGHDDKFISFKPETKDVEQSGASAGVQAKVVDPMSGGISSIAGAFGIGGDGKQEQSLGAKAVNTVVRNANGVVVKVTKAVVAQNPEIAKAVTAKKTNDDADGGVKASLRMLGMYPIKVSEIVTVAGVAKRHQGNWRVEKKVTEVKTSIATTFGLSKNGTAKDVKAGAAANKDVNKSEGDPKAKGTKRVKYSVNGERGR